MVLARRRTSFTTGCFTPHINEEKTMKIMNIVFCLFIAVSISACGAHTKVARLDPEGKCPVGETCISFASSGMDAEGGGVQKSTYLFQNEQGQNGNVRPAKVDKVYAGIGSDRFDTFGTALLGAGAHVAGTVIKSNATKDAAEITGRYAVESAKVKGPDTVLYNYLSSSSSSTSAGGVGIGGSAFSESNPTTTVDVDNGTQVGVAVAVE